ncbi:MAG: hypothetical protein ABWY93_02260 [Mycobacterium sp.]
MTVLTLLTTTLVPMVSVISTATVAIWTKRIDARTKQEDRTHALLLDFEKRAGDDKKAVLKRLISAIMHVKRGAESLAGTEQSISDRRAAAIRELYEFRARLGLDDGVAELLIYASEPVRDLTELLLDEWDRQFREQGYSLVQLDTCKEQLVQTDANEQRWAELKNEEALWLKQLGEQSDLDVEALIALCNQILKAAHTDLRGGFGVEMY